jgi:hypothetical protein
MPGRSESGMPSLAGWNGWFMRVRTSTAVGSAENSAPNQDFSPRHRRDLSTITCYGLLAIADERQGSCVSDRRPHEVRS